MRYIVGQPSSTVPYFGPHGFHSNLPPFSPARYFQRYHQQDDDDGNPHPPTPGQPSDLGEPPPAIFGAPSGHYPPISQGNLPDPDMPLFGGAPAPAAMWGLPGDGPFVMTIGTDDSAANDGDGSGLGLEQDEATTFMVTGEYDRNGSSGEVKTSREESPSHHVCFESNSLEPQRCLRY